MVMLLLPGNVEIDKTLESVISLDSERDQICLN